MRAIFLAACSSVDELVQTLDPTDWVRPGLPGWTVRDLAGHTGRAMATVVTYTARPADTLDVSSAADYYVRLADVDHEQVADRGRQAGHDLGEDAAAAFRGLTTRVRAALVEHPRDDEVIETLAGGTRIGDYLPTRTLELVVHGQDLAAATGREISFPAEVEAETLQLLALLAVARGRSGPLLRSLTGRGGLPAGFSVL